MVIVQTRFVSINSMDERNICLNNSQTTGLKVWKKKLLII